MPAYIRNVTTQDDETSVDWDGLGTFYYKKDMTSALVLTPEDNLDIPPAFSSAADISELIDSDEWDLPVDAFDIISSATWAPEPPSPPTEEEVLP